MSAQLASAVENRMESPTEGTVVTLIVGVSCETTDAVEPISTIGAEVEEQLPYRSLAISIDESNLHSLCDLEIVETVEIEKEYTTRGDDNFFSR